MQPKVFKNGVRKLESLRYRVALLAWS